MVDGENQASKPVTHYRHSLPAPWFKQLREVAHKPAEPIQCPFAYEDPIQSGGVDVANDLFKADGSVTETWFQLRYDATTSGFSSGSAPDVAGAPGAWSWSAERTDVADTDAADGWYVGLAYSSHGDLSLSDGKEGLHGVTFDNFSITSIPEPSTALLGLSALGFLIRRKR